MQRPLAALLRPETLDDVFGQRHLLAKDRVFYKMLKNGRIPNMVFFGPPGVGKTTVARIIARDCNMQLFALNGTAASTADIRTVIAQIDTLSGMNGILLYLDEIQYLNKKQQQSLLECIEEGGITLIASTTENPNFYIYSALLSRCTVFEFKPVDEQDVQLALDRAVQLLANDSINVRFVGDARKQLARAAAGDVRKAVTALDLLCAGCTGGDIEITPEMVLQVTMHSTARYDRADDEHYHLLSALQKSIRGSDENAALHYLARLLAAGDLISPCRRLLVIASEDIGLAYPLAAAVTKACVDSALQLGLPEGGIPLAEAVVMLATAPKSNSANAAYEQAMQDVLSGNYSELPSHLINNLPKGKTAKPYLYPHAYPDHYVQQQYLPDKIKDAVYYRFADNKSEQAAKQYWEKIKGNKKK